MKDLGAALGFVIGVPLAIFFTVALLLLGHGLGIAARAPDHAACLRRDRLSAGSWVGPMIGELILCASIALVVMIPAWADDPREVVRMIRRRKPL